MGILQLYLRGGSQTISLPNTIPKGSITLKHASTTFNVENHGFYMATVTLPFLYTSNTQSNLSTRGLLLSIDHAKSTTSQQYNFRMGEVEIPRNFEVNVDLDSGHQVLLETDTRAGASFPFNTHFGAPSWASTNYYNGTAPVGAYTSIGVSADTIAAGTIPTTSGVIDGPTPFLYSMILTFEYEDGLIEERLQQLIS